MKLETKTLDIGGMTCSSCVRTVEEAVRQQDGIENASVNYASEKLQVTYDREKANVEGILCEKS